MTNGDKIREMTDSELAFFLSSRDAKPCTHCPFDDFIGCKGDIVCTEKIVRDAFAAWLSSEAISERSENSCSLCEHYDSVLGCTLDGSCPHD